MRGGDKTNNPQPVHAPMPDDDRLHPPLRPRINRRIAMTDDQFLEAVQVELDRARDAFPGTEHQLEALHEEVGELSRAMMHHTHEDGVTPQDIQEEAVQVAVMALRVAVEGDSTFAYRSE